MEALLEGMKGRGHADLHSDPHLRMDARHTPKGGLFEDLGASTWDEKSHTKPSSQTRRSPKRQSSSQPKLRRQATSVNDSDSGDELDVINQKTPMPTKYKPPSAEDPDGFRDKNGGFHEWHTNYRPRTLPSFKKKSSDTLTTETSDTALQFNGAKKEGSGRSSQSSNRALSQDRQTRDGHEASQSTSVSKGVFCVYLNLDLLMTCVWHFRSVHLEAGSTASL